MNELEQLKREREEVFADYLRHERLRMKHEQKARNARERYVELGGEIRSIEREVLATPIRLVYGKPAEGVKRFYIK